MDLNTSDLCTMCNMPATMSCDRCKSARYCGGYCQNLDGYRHGLLCENYSTFDISTRPSPEHFRAFLFPVDEDNPQVIWLRCKWHNKNNSDGENPYQYPEVRSFYGPGAFPRPMSIQYNSFLKRKLPNTIHVMYNDHFLMDDSKPNHSIAAFLAGRPEGFRVVIRGPVIAYGNVGPDIDQGTCRDLDMNDLRHIVDFLILQMLANN